MRTKLIIAFALLIMGCSLQAQTIFSEDFDDITVVNEVGPLPDGWLMYGARNTNVSNFAFFGSGWIVSNVESPNQAAASVSAINESGNCDRWLVTPAIQIPATGYSLTFRAYVPEANGTEKLRVMVSTTGTDKADFSTTLRDIIFDGTTAGWCNFNLPLSDFAGQHVHVAFVNHGHNYFVFLDNVKVSIPTTISTWHCWRTLPRSTAATVPKDTKPSPMPMQVWRTGWHGCRTTVCSLVAFVTTHGSDVRHRQVLNTAKSGRITQDSGHQLGISQAPLDLAVNVYPNPASDRVYISSNSTILNLTIVNCMGQIVSSHAGDNADVAELDISQLATGTYIVKAITKNGSAIERLCITKIRSTATAKEQRHYCLPSTHLPRSCNTETPQYVGFQCTWT